VSARSSSGATGSGGPGNLTTVNWTSGWRAWLTFILGCLFFSYGFFQRVSPSVMVEDLMREFAVGAAILGNLSAFYFYSYAALQVPIGLLLDRFGPRRLLSAAAALCALGSLLFAMAPDVTVAYLGRLLIGTGAGFTWVGALTLVTLFFPPHRFAFLVGVSQFFGMVGGVLGQAPLAAAVAAYGWRATMTAAAVVGALLAALLYLVVRDRPRADTVGGQAAVTMAAAIRRVAANPQTWIAALLGGCFVGPVLAFGGLWGVPYLMQSHGIDRPQAAGAVSFFFIGFGFGAPILGWLSDHVHRRRLPLLFATTCSLSTLLVIFHGPALPLWAACIVFAVHGFGAGGMVLSVASAREHNPPNVTGAVYGLVNTAVVGGGALLQPLIGWLLDLNWDGRMEDGARVYAPEAFALALAVLPAVSAVGVLAALATRETHCRQSA